MRRILEYAGRGRLVVFVGAGASVIPPTSLPSWRAVNQAVVEALGQRISGLTGVDRARELGALIIARQRADKLPPEYQAEIIAHRMRDSYFQVLQCLDGEVPNAAHLALAALAKTGNLRAVITTNFDRLLEAAFRQIGVPLEVHSHPDHFNAVANDLERFERPDAPCQLLKLHGSAEDPATLIDTLEQRKVGLSAAKTACLRHLLRFGHWVFLGYSGADLAAEPNYLHLRSEAPRACGLTWLVRFGTDPLPAVVQLVELYGERAAIISGELPAWLESLVMRATGNALPYEPPDSRTQAQETTGKVAEHTRNWAESRRLDHCVLVMANLLRATGYSRDALDLVRMLYENTSPEERASAHFAVVADSLANQHRDRGEYDQAIALFQEGLELLERLNIRTLRAGILNNMALISERQGRYEEALARFRATLAASDEAGNEDGSGVALHNMAMVEAKRGNFSEALRLYREALAITEKLGDEPGRAEVLNNIGELQVKLEDPDSALGNFVEVIKIRDRLGDDRGVALAQGNIANVHLRQGRYSEAEDMYRRCRTVFELFDDRPNLTTTLGGLAEAARVEGRLDESISLLDQAFALAAQNGCEPELAGLQMQRGRLFARRTEPDQAIECFNEVLAICQRIADPLRRRDVLTDLAIFHEKREDFHEAEVFFRKALSITEELGQHHYRNWVRNRLGKLLNTAGLEAQEEQELDRAITLFRSSFDFNELLQDEAVTPEQKLGTLRNSGNTLMNIAHTHVMKGELEKAVPIYEDALARLEQGGDVDRVRHIAGILGSIHIECARIEEGVESYKRAETRCSTEAQRKDLRDLVRQAAERQARFHVYPSAIRLYRECLRLSSDLNDRSAIAPIQLEVGRLLLELMDEPLEARGFLQAASDYFARERSPQAAAARDLMKACAARLREFEG